MNQPPKTAMFLSFSGSRELFLICLRRALHASEVRVGFNPEMSQLTPPDPKYGVQQLIHGSVGIFPEPSSLRNTVWNAIPLAVGGEHHL